MTLFVRFILWFARLLLSLRYRIVIKGMEQLKGHTRALLFLPNHTAFIDPVIIMAILGPKFALRPVSDKNQLAIPVFGAAIRAMRPFLLPDLRRDGRKDKNEVHLALQEAAHALQAGDNILLYPSGRITYDGKERIGANSAAYQLATVPGVTPVIIRTSGLWGSRFSRAYGTEPNLSLLALTAIKMALANFFIFAPRRTVELEISIAPALSSVDKTIFNNKLEHYYNNKQPSVAYQLPLYFWQGNNLTELPQKTSNIKKADLTHVDVDIHEKVLSYLSELTGRHEINPEQNLGSDLGLDSLASIEIAAWLSEEFGIHIADTSALHTVSDVLLAASGETIGSGEFTVPHASKLWNKRFSYTPPLENANKLTDLYIAAATQLPFKPIATDMRSGTKSYATFTTGLFILKKAFSGIREERVGLMIPASIAAASAYYGLLFAGKVPVLVNWTHGQSIMNKSLDTLGVKNIVTSRTVMAALSLLETDFPKITFIHLEDMSAQISQMEKLCALAKSICCPRLLAKGLDIPETAAILFTSGSEAQPKAVPLTHKNFISVLREIPDIAHFKPTDRVMGILPPFHSFGLLLNLLLPYNLGIPIAYYPNPTEGAIIRTIIREYRTSIVAATPTFFSNIMHGANRDDLTSIRYAVVGAEKCPEVIYKRLSTLCPHGLLLEGYGVTECAPLISINRPEEVKPGSLGRIISSMESVIVDVETGKRVNQGERGILLVRGPNVFPGYLSNAPSPFVYFEGKDWYSTGDMVHEDADNILFFEGRLKRFVKIGGEMLSLAAIETALNTHLADNESVFALETQGTEDRPELVAFTTQHFTREELNKTLRNAQYSGLYNIKKVIQIDELPLLGTGKIDYQRLKAMLKEI